MKRGTAFAAAALGMALAAPGFAGSGEKCTQDAQACLNRFASYQSKGWVGIEYDKTADEKGHVVKRTLPGSPAEAAGFKAGDILVSLNGVALTADKAALKQAKGDWSVGQSVSYKVSRGNKEVALTVKLGAMPKDVLARMVGDHMIRDHMSVASAAAVK